MVKPEFHDPSDPDSLYHQHVEEYWKKILETPEDGNLLTDSTGDRHDVTTNPVFLANSVIGDVERTLDVSSDKSFFIPVNPVEICECELDKGENVNDLIEIAKKDQDSPGKAILTIDDEPQDVKEEAYRIHQGLFQVNIPKNALQGLAPAGVCKAAADGYYVKLKPLTPGKHKIRIQGKVDYPLKEQFKPWEHDILYTINVTEAPQEK